MNDDQLKKLAVIAHFVTRSPDLAARALVELEQRGVLADATALFRVPGLAPLALLIRSAMKMPTKITIRHSGISAMVRNEAAVAAVCMHQFR